MELSFLKIDVEFVFNKPLKYFLNELFVFFRVVLYVDDYIVEIDYYFFVV